jgi:hypothetical protein
MRPMARRAAAGGGGRAPLLHSLRHGVTVRGLLAEPGHGLVGVVQGQRFGTGNTQTLAPIMGVAIRPGHQQSMQHGQVDGALDIEAEAAFAQQAAQDVTTAGLLPQLPEHQVGADAEPPKLRQLTAVEAGQHDRAAGVARGRGDQAVEQIGVLDRIAAAERLDDALDVAAALAGVLDEVEVLVWPDLLDADEHGAQPDCVQATTATRSESSLAAGFQHKGRADLAPQIAWPSANPRNSAGFRSPEAQRCGSWVKRALKLPRL